MRRCVHNLSLPLTLGLLSQIEIKTKWKRENLAIVDLVRRRPDSLWPARAAFRGTIRPDREAFLPNVSCSHNHSKPSARSHFHGGNYDASARPSRSTGQNILPNRGALPPAADRKNKFQPTWQRHLGTRVPARCCKCIRRPRLNRARASRCQLP